MPIPCKEADIKSLARELGAYDANGSETLKRTISVPESH